MKMCGTLEYMSPEVLNSTQASPASGSYLNYELTNMHRNVNKPFFFRYVGFGGCSLPHGVWRHVPVLGGEQIQDHGPHLEM